MIDSRKVVRSRWGQLLVTLFSSFLASLFICWLLGTPSKSAIFKPPERWNDVRYQYHSIVIPTYKEAESLKATIAGLRRANLGTYEIIVVDDDSQDDTQKVIHYFQTLEGMDIRLIVRHGVSGLSSAVLEGIKAAQGELILVMDADGQHPPEAVKGMLRMLQAVPDAQIALGTRTRYAENWPWHRRLISWGATKLANPLTHGAVRDPMTGFFAVRAEVVRRALPLNVTGFKVALELLVKSVLVEANFETPVSRRVMPVPYEFKTRTRGTSKLGAKVVLQYALQIFSLYYFVMGVKLPLLMTLPLALAYYVAGVFLACYGRCRSRRRYTRLGSPSAFDSNEERALENGKEHTS